MAMIYPDPTRYRRGGSNLSATKELSGARLSVARAVLRAAPEDLALQVLAGTLTLDTAHATAQERKAEKATNDERNDTSRSSARPSLKAVHHLDMVWPASN